VGLQGGAELVATQDAKERGDLKLAGFDEGANLVVFLGALSDGNTELAAESNQSVSRENFQDTPFRKTGTLHVRGSS
jgi:hypothetical protein